MRSTGKPGITSKIRKLAGSLREWKRPLLFVLILCFSVMTVQPWNGLDRNISDRLLVRQKTPVDPAILIVQIEPEDVRRYGVLPISRATMADALDRIERGGAERVLVDLYLGVPVLPENDAKLAKVLERLGPRRVGLVTSPRPIDLPYSLFAKHGSVLDGRLSPDVDGMHRSTGKTEERWGPIMARWLASGELSTQPVPFDLRIAAPTYRRVSLHQAIEGQVDFSGKLVIFSTSSEIAPSRALLPMTAKADRAAVIALGAQSLRQNYPAALERGQLADKALGVFVILLGFVIALTTRSGRSMIVMLVTCAVVLFTTDLWIGKNLAVAIHPVAMVTYFAVTANVTLIQRLQIVPMMLSFLKGDISPEEAWAWRSYGSAQNAVVLFGADGRIKRANSEAERLPLALETLAPLCIPAFGERAVGFRHELPDGSARHFEIDWPHASVPLVMLRETTETEALHQTMREQLMTDDLTGLINRRGFDYALSAAVRANNPYAVLFLDMNGFKAVNDTWGHDAGDELLVRSARRVASAVRPGDTVARLGGDEFAIVACGDIDELNMARLADRISHAVSRPLKLSQVERELQISVAVGYALPLTPDEDANAVLRRADQAMYRAKRHLKAKAA
jgi:diguanylate cyclase (GGDEF)-like protein